MTVATQDIAPDDAADAALAYALWDSENTVRMKAECIQEHIARAKAVRHWLKLHGHDVKRLNYDRTVTAPAVATDTPPS